MEANDWRYGNFQSKELILSHQVALFNTAGIRTSRKIQEFYKVMHSNKNSDFSRVNPAYLQKFL